MAECPCTPADIAGLVEVFLGVDNKQFRISWQANVGETTWPGYALSWSATLSVVNHAGASV